MREIYATSSLLLVCVVMRIADGFGVDGWCLLCLGERERENRESGGAVGVR